MANYQEGQNAMSLDDRQNIVIARLNSLNEAVTKAKTARLQKESLHRQLGNVTADTPGVDTFPVRRAEHDDPGDQAAARARSTPRRPRLLPDAHQRTHPDVAKVNGADRERRTARLRSRDEQSPRVDRQRLPHRAGGGAEPERLARGAEAPDDRPQPQEHQLQHPAARSRGRAPRLQRADAAGKGNARRQQQPREQRAVDGCRGSAGRPLHAEPRPRLADGAGARAGARRRPSPTRSSTSTTRSRFPTT